MKDCFSKLYPLIKSKKYKEVLRLVCTEDGKNINSPYDSDINHSWYIIGDIHYKTENYDLAISAFKKAVSVREDDDEALLAIANCYSNQGKIQLAEKFLRKAITLKPKESYLYNLGNALYDQSKYQEAIDLYKSISEEDTELHELAKKNIEHAKKKLKNIRVNS
jgi:tetratricopeptide (TPR) repeat protein